MAAQKEGKCARCTFVGAGATIASSSSEDEMTRFLPLAAGGGVALDFEGDFADALDIVEGRGRAEGCALVLPEQRVQNKAKPI
jgi:hypothetical protein